MTNIAQAPAHVVISYDFLPKIGGAHLWLYEVYRRWHSGVVVLTVEPAQDDLERREQAGFDAKDHGQLSIARRLGPIGEINFLDPRCVMRFYEHCREVTRLVTRGQVQLHALRAFPEGITGALLRLRHPRRTRLVTYAHGEEVLIAQTSTQLRLATRMVYRSSDLVIVNSESTRRLVRAVCPSARTECIHPGVDVREYGLSQDEIAQQRNAWGVQEGDVVIATVARMEPRKNHEAVIRALGLLRDEGLALHYVCGGDGEQRAYLIDLVHSLDLQRWVRFLGRVSDAEKRRIFAAADIHAMPSVLCGPLTEGFGIVFIEAAAAGRPSISGSVGGQSEAVRNGETGLVVDGSDLAAVAEAMRQLVMNSALRARMGERARRWAQEHDWARVVAKTASAIQRATASV